MERLSYSTINLYEQCSLRFYFRYIKRLPTVQWDHFDLGTFCHRVLELFYMRLAEGIPVKQAMSMSFEETKKEFPNMKTALYAEARILIRNFLIYLKENSSPQMIAANLSQEQEFSFDYKGWKIVGIIDRVDKIGENEYEIIDYKTTKNEQSVYKSKLQLDMYGLALVKKYGSDIKITGSYYLLRHGKKTSFDVTRKDMKKALEKIGKVGDSIKQSIELNDWQSNPTPLCNWCDFKLDCPDSPYAKKNRTFGKLPNDFKLKTRTKKKEKSKKSTNNKSNKEFEKV